SSRCRRHSEIDDVYNPSRRSSALRPSRSRRSYSARILSLYCAENTRRLARSGTSGSAGSSTGSACRPDTSVVINIDGHLSDALRLANFGVRPASPNVDTEGVAIGGDAQEQEHDDGMLSWSHLFARGQATSGSRETLEWLRPSPDDIASLIFT